MMGRNCRRTVARTSAFHHDAIRCIRDLCSLLWIVKYIPDAGCSHEQLKQHDADAFHR